MAMKKRAMKKLEKSFDKLYEMKDGDKHHIPVEMKGGYTLYAGAVLYEGNELTFGEADMLFGYETFYPVMKTRIEEVIAWGKPFSLGIEREEDGDVITLVKVKGGTVFVCNDFEVAGDKYDFFFDGVRIVKGVPKDIIVSMKKLTYEEVQQLNW